MITIIEGADGTGKTTYAQKLSERFNAKYLHAEQPKTRLCTKRKIETMQSLKRSTTAIRSPFFIPGFG